ncbi:hypothetical protein EUTSA_v10009841mg [Eutrema salsugineum]|uniref:DUF4283 domain-containing protein n=1 Tax=Eutrema salsugineum TaxID=72664 RepID=V4KV17_EUTSA|nr:hypothetical protein EUTSA_v10009841mg [Eutrema salsugineum]
MTQSKLIKHHDSRKKVEQVSKRLKISVPKFDNANLIEGYSRTLIGRCMNPQAQDMKTLLFMLPRIWKVEERVAGADLGLGRFQFDFDREEDIVEIMKMEPFHFDYWMLSLVRWTPVVDPNYPSAITFWIRVIGVPLHFWADLTFRTIGKALGKVEAVNLNEGKIQVIIDGLKPLCFETLVEFHSGEETTVFLRYERLFGYCRQCFSLCHDYQRFPDRMENAGRRMTEHGNDDPQDESGAVSFKAAAVNGKAGSGELVKTGNLGGSYNGQDKGKGKNYDYRGGQRRHHYEDNFKQNKTRSEWRGGEGSSRYGKLSGYVHPKEWYPRIDDGQDKLQLEEKEVSDNKVQSKGKSARKSLSFEDNDGEIESDSVTILNDDSMASLPVAVSTISEPGNDVPSKEEATGAEYKTDDYAEEHMQCGILSMLEDVGEQDGFGNEAIMEHEEGEFMEPSDAVIQMIEEMTTDNEEVEKMTTVDATMEPIVSKEGDTKEGGCSKPEAREKNTRSNMQFLGGNTKKRLVQTLVSPRKKHVAKSLNRGGEAANKDDPKGSLNPKMDPKP